MSCHNSHHKDILHCRHNHCYVRIRNGSLNYTEELSRDLEVNNRLELKNKQVKKKQR